MVRREYAENGKKWMFLKDGMNFLVVETQYVSEAGGSGFGWLLTNFQMLWTLKGEADSDVA